jgi:CYTH domain-containing protein
LKCLRDLCKGPIIEKNRYKMENKGFIM